MISSIFLKQQFNAPPVQRASVDNYRPLFSPLPVCKPTTYVKILDSTNKIVARYHSDDDSFNNSVYDLKEFNWLNFKDSEGDPYHIEFLQGYTWTRFSQAHQTIAVRITGNV